MVQLTKMLSAAAVLAGCWGGAAQAVTTVFQDPSLAFFLIQTNYTNTATLDVQNCGNCGNPGSALSVAISQPGTAAVGSNVAALGFVNSQFTYDPGTQGAITSIDASVSKNFSATVNGANGAPTDFFTFNNTFRPLIKQDGNYYSGFILSSTPLVTPMGGGSATTGFTTISSTGLTASNFSLFDPSTGTFDANSHPNFAGSQIDFGLFHVLGSTNPEDSTVTAVFDNYNLAVQSAGPGAPAPLLGMGLLPALGSMGGLAVTRGRRRKRAPKSALPEINA